MEDENEKSVTELISELTSQIAQKNASDAVQKAALTPAGGDDPLVVEKAITGVQQDEAFVDPLRKTFERLAKASPMHFGALGATKTLDNPYGILRQKNADGSYVVSNHQLEAMIRGSVAVNGNTIDEKRASGAMLKEEWMEKSGSNKTAIENAMYNGAQMGSFGNDGALAVKAALDSSAGGALIRTDLEPLLYEAFLRSFPGVDALAKIPANGLVHTWVQQTAMGTAEVVSELGSLSATESYGTYGQQASTNIAVIASQRAVGLKAQFASQQSGMNFNLGGSQNTEVVNGIRSIAARLQALIFQGNQNASASSAVADDEDGLYNAHSLTGLRQQLKDSGYSITKSDTDSYLNTLRKAVAQLINAGADLSTIMMFLSPGAQNAIDGELEQFFTVPKGTEGGPHPTNFGSGGLRMLQDILLRSKMVPAGAQTAGIGYYTLSATVREDIYLLDPEGIKLPYLGSPTPTILELPTGYNNALSNVYIPFCMMGLAIYVKAFNRKVRIARQVV